MHGRERSRRPNPFHRNRNVSPRRKLTTAVRRIRFYRRWLTACPQCGRLNERYSQRYSIGSPPVCGVCGVCHSTACVIRSRCSTAQPNQLSAQAGRALSFCAVWPCSRHVAFGIHAPSPKHSAGQLPVRDVPAVSAGANSASLSRACTSRLGMSGHRMRRYSRRSVGRRRTLQPQISVPSGLSLVRPFLELSKVRGCAFVGRGRGRCRPPTRSQPEWPDGRTRPRLCTGEAGRYSPGRAAAVA
jgi:hypothetical protein